MNTKRREKRVKKDKLTLEQFPHLDPDHDFLALK